MTDLTIRRVAPFGHPGITVCVQLPQAYRSLPRPSSPLDAKASTVCLIAFDLKIYLLLNHIIQKKRTIGVRNPHIWTSRTRSTIQSNNCQRAKTSNDRVRPEVRATRGLSPDDPKVIDYSSLQKGGDPAAGSPTATLLRLRPSYRICLRPLPPEGWVTDFGHSRLPWRDGRCVQGPGTYSPWRS